MGGNGGTPNGVDGTTGGECYGPRFAGGGATQSAVGVNSGYSNLNGDLMVGGGYSGGGGGGLYGGAGSTGGGGGGGSSTYNYNAAGSAALGLTFVSGTYGVAASAVSGSVSITYTLLIGVLRWYTFPLL